MEDFSFTVYRRLLQHIVDLKRPVGGVEDYLTGKIGQRGVVLRHDVDRRTAKAVKMARLENQLGIVSTYYFRRRRKGFETEAIEEIGRLGHHTGYHYETLSGSNGDHAAALEMFVRNLKEIDRIAPCRTVCAHGAPLSRHDNNLLLENRRWKQYELLGDAQLSFRDLEIVYFTDTGGKWNSGGGVNLRDQIQTARTIDNPRNTGDLIKMLEVETGVFYLSTHPERWGDGTVDKLYCRTLDAAVNVVKRAVRLTRHLLIRNKQK